jgi:hypothetical protein
MTRSELIDPAECVPPLGSRGHDLADTVVDRIALHVRARFPGCSQFTLNEITSQLLGLRAEIERLLHEYEEDVARELLRELREYESDDAEE